MVGNIDSLKATGGLTASVAAVQYGLYERFGFRTIDVHTYGDVERFPNAKPITMTTMVRDRSSA